MSKYISLENLERYDAKMQEHFATFCASKEDGMWRQTEKAGAVSFWPVGNSPLEGTVEFMFKETPPTSGDKSPTNPSTISGVSSIGLTVCQEAGVDEHTYTLSLGSTYYGGSIDLATGVMTVAWEGIALVTSPQKNYGWRSVEDYIEEGVYRYQLSIMSNATGNVSCSHLPKGGYGGPLWSLYPRTNGRCVMVLPYATVAEVEAWIQSEYEAGHPVTIVYELGTPYTVQLIPPQIRALPQPDKYVPRLNTVYSDADAVQIVYQKNPVRDKFEKVQAIIAQGGNV